VRGAKRQIVRQAVQGWDDDDQKTGRNVTGSCAVDTMNEVDAKEKRGLDRRKRKGQCDRLYVKRGTNGKSASTITQSPSHRPRLSHFALHLPRSRYQFPLGHFYDQPGVAA